MKKTLQKERRILRVVLGLGLAASLLSCNLRSPGSPVSPPITSTPEIPASALVTPTSTPFPTPTPIIRIENGDRSLANGDTENAMLQYRAAFIDSSDPEIKAAALWGLARAQFTEKRYADTLASLRQLIAEYPASSHLGHAYFLEGRAFYEMERFEEAAAAYQSYLTVRPGVLDSYVQQLRGDALTAA
ncbi:MAG: tetratricopeptide repeat protein, partial [Chloroflexi bacterium]|nr:tetratricopeptide repeat protein [Chloroflexota bacterium]